ncbi:MAG TPA: hypothetical protein PK706_13770 [Xanthobacteraceae bacterium]|jgi:hypothetical protein|nr:hypothetical protein [Xanthobacteraceae bacterium]
MNEFEIPDKISQEMLIYFFCRFRQDANKRNEARQYTLASEANRFSGNSTAICRSRSCTQHSLAHHSSVEPLILEQISVSRLVGVNLPPAADALMGALREVARTS